MELQLHITTVEEITVVLREIESFTQGLKIANRSLYNIQLIADEFLSNLFNHGQNHQPMAVDIHLAFIDDQWKLEVIDNSLAFDFTSIPIVFSTSEIEKRKIGGLGIPLIRSLVDNVSYQRTENKNKTIFIIAK